jgi:hypothetical protein
MTRFKENAALVTLQNVPIPEDQKDHILEDSLVRLLKTNIPVVDVSTITESRYDA